MYCVSYCWELFTFAASCRTAVANFILCEASSNHSPRDAHLALFPSKRKHIFRNAHANHLLRRRGHDWILQPKTITWSSWATVLLVRQSRLQLALLTPKFWLLNFHRDRYLCFIGCSMASLTKQVFWRTKGKNSEVPIFQWSDCVFRRKLHPYMRLQLSQYALLPNEYDGQQTKRVFQHSSDGYSNRISNFCGDLLQSLE